MKSKTEDMLIVSYYIVFFEKRCVSVFKMGAPENGSALGSADLGITTPTKANRKETTSQKSETVSVLNILKY